PTHTSRTRLRLSRHTSRPPLRPDLSPRPRRSRPLGLDSPLIWWSSRFWIPPTPEYKRRRS
ncbi:hypothetical protein LINPERPRIM_LOCUS35748, partial [Linum perenne]